MSKGSRQRPTNKEAFNENYDRIFNREAREKALDELSAVSQELESYGEEDGQSSSSESTD